MLLFAIEVHHQYVLNFKKDTSNEYVRISGNEMRKALRQDCGYLTEEETDIFLSYLDVYFGLRMAKICDGLCGDSVPKLSGCFNVIKK